MSLLANATYRRNRLEEAFSDMKHCVHLHRARTSITQSRSRALLAKWLKVWEMNHVWCIRATQFSAKTSATRLQACFGEWIEEISRNACIQYLGARCQKLAVTWYVHCMVSKSKRRY